jgi:hypothetical protein
MIVPVGAPSVNAGSKMGHFGTFPTRAWIAPLGILNRIRSRLRKTGRERRRARFRPVQVLSGAVPPDAAATSRFIPDFAAGKIDQTVRAIPPVFTDKPLYRPLL